MLVAVVVVVTLQKTARIVDLKVNHSASGLKDAIFVGSVPTNMCTQLTLDLAPGSDNRFSLGF